MGWRDMGPSLETGAVFDAALGGYWHRLRCRSVMGVQEICDEKKAGGRFRGRGGVSSVAAVERATSRKAREVARPEFVNIQTVSPGLTSRNVAHPPQ